MALPDLTRKLTYEAYVLISDEGQCHEILDGEHYAAIMNCPSRLSQLKRRLLVQYSPGGDVR
jgi:hypothetical protein